MEQEDSDFVIAQKIISIAEFLKNEALNHARFYGIELKKEEKDIAFYFIPACESLEKPLGYFEEVPADTERDFYDHPSMKGVCLHLKK